MLYLGQVVREHYLRDDIQSGSPLDPRCDPEAAKLAADAPHYLVVDTNIVLQQVLPSKAAQNLHFNENRGRKGMTCWVEQHRVLEECTPLHSQEPSVMHAAHIQ